MFRFRLLAVLLGLGSLSACDNRPVVDDRGDGCTEELVTLKVEVVSADGAPVRGATVTAINATTNQSITSVTNEEGVSRAINESLAPGTTQLSATAGPKVAPPVQVEWECDECHCTPIPGAVRLRLNP